MAVKSFDSIRPKCSKHRSIRVNLNGSAKHTLGIILIELKIFGCKPFIPVGLFDELATGKFHHAGDWIQNPPIIHNLVGRRLTKVSGHCRELPSVVVLIVDLLCKERWGRHNWQTAAWNVRANFRVSE
jgi:hypothetical protein